MSTPSAGARAADPAPVFAALGSNTRLSLLAKLSDGRARSIVGLAEDGPLTRQAVTKHLRVLETAGLVSRRRTGRESHFTFRPQPIDDARAWLDAVSRQWDDALERLRVFVEPEA
jgi:DNA-binding transcriptional ArsR family regulator